MKNEAMFAMLRELLDEAEIEEKKYIIIGRDKWCECDILPATFLPYDCDLEKIAAVARSLAEASTMSIEEAACALARIGDFSMSVEDMLCAISDSMYEPDGAIHEDDDFPKTQIAFQRHMIPAFKYAPGRRALRELYGQGVDAGPLAARPGLIRPADDGPWRAETGIHKEDCTMERLTTDHPQDNIETALNLFYVKDGEAWARNGGAAPEYQDVRLFDYARRIIHDHRMEEMIDPNAEDMDFAEQISGALFDGVETESGLIATLYTAAWAFAELREKLKQYEDAEEAGKLLWLPCKLGTPVYRIHRVFGECSMSSEPFSLSALEDFGTRVFLTVTEAADALDALRKRGMAEIYADKYGKQD